MKRIGKYTITRHVGEGRYSNCYLANSSDDFGSAVVIKRFKPGIFSRNKDKNYFEAVILSQLKHSGIPELLGVVNEGRFYGFVLEYKQGRTVKDMLFKDKHKFAKEEIYDIGTRLIEIIKYIHGAGVVHRDIRIPNVVIDGSEVYLIDFGLARWAQYGKYQFDLDFSFLGDFFLYLLYSTFQQKEKTKKSPWHQELNLTPLQRAFLKRLLGIEGYFLNAEEVGIAFEAAFRL